MNYYAPPPQSTQSDFLRNYLGSLFMIEQLHRLLLDVIRDEFERLKVSDINPVQAFLIYNIGKQEVSAGELRTRGYYQGSNVSYNLKQLVKLGYIQNQRSPNDRRSIRVRLTERGFEIHNTLRKLLSGHADQLEQMKTISSQDILSMNLTMKKIENYWSSQIRYIY